MDKEMGSTKRDALLEGAEAGSSNGNFSSPPMRPVHRQDGGANAPTGIGRGRLKSFFSFKISSCTANGFDNESIAVIVITYRWWNRILSRSWR